MATCGFCGRPADREKASHDECQDRHHRATIAIPGFFRRILDSGISAERFANLLHEAAEASFVRPDELNDLCLAGVSGLVSDILEHRLVTESEEQRIGEILESLNAELLQSPGLATLFAKNEILRGLSEGKVPDRIEVVGAMPLALRKTESVLWIFNGARIYSSGQRPVEPDEMPPPLSGDYYAQRAFSARDPDARKTGKTGDLVLTNYTVFFMWSLDQHWRYPISRIAGLRAHVDAVEIGHGNKIVTFLVSDPWFLTNALTLLSRRFRGSDGRVASATSAAGPAHHRS